jgi:hypothetical protein
MKEKKKMCQQIAELIQQKIGTVNKAFQLNVIPLKYEEDIVHEEATSLEFTHLECTEDNVHEEDTETQGNEAERTSADPSLNCEVLPERDQQQETRISNRKRRPPVKLSKDFL